ncbi:LPXTG cell wall anchor domain-containing protein [Streptomyces sp. URMC 126]|uniref:LPXTG cell wall anchor domain-containing protein n=1 Tax=Streptomyces sp. URMC 126 TaxID=3423401 RepID=UPI003F1B60AB
MVALPAGAEEKSASDASLASPDKAAVTWAVSRLVDGDGTEPDAAQGDHLPGDDVGLTADFVIGAAASQTAREAADRATNWLQKQAGGYLHPTRGKAVSAGAAAKLALVAAIEDRDPTAFGGDPRKGGGGHDLIDLLLHTQQKNGQFQDTELDPGQDKASRSAQSLAILALQQSQSRIKNADVAEKVRDEALPHAVAHLVTTHCARDDGFSSAARPDPKTCTSDVEGTAMALQALIPFKESNPDAKKVVSKAFTWLQKQQKPNGSFNGTDGKKSVGGTALAVQALTANGDGTNADRGVRWLKRLQCNCSSDVKAADRGAVPRKKNQGATNALTSTVSAIPGLAKRPFLFIDSEGWAKPTYVVKCSGGSGSTGTSGGTGGSPDPGGDTSGKGKPSRSPSPSTSSPAPGRTASETASPSPSASASTADTTTGGTGTGGTGSTSTGYGSSGGSGSGGSTGSSGNLAATGADRTVPLALGAGALVVAGAGAVVFARRRRGDRV